MQTKIHLVPSLLALTTLAVACRPMGFLKADGEVASVTIERPTGAIQQSEYSRAVIEVRESNGSAAFAPGGDGRVVSLKAGTAYDLRLKLVLDKPAAAGAAAQTLIIASSAEGSTQCPDIKAKTFAAGANTASINICKLAAPIPETNGGQASSNADLQIRPNVVDPNSSSSSSARLDAVAREIQGALASATDLEKLPPLDEANSLFTGNLVTFGVSTIKTASTEATRLLNQLKAMGRDSSSAFAQKRDEVCAQLQSAHNAAQPTSTAGFTGAHTSLFAMAATSLQAAKDKLGCVPANVATALQAGSNIHLICDGMGSWSKVYVTSKLVSSFFSADRLVFKALSIAGDGSVQSHDLAPHNVTNAEGVAKIEMRAESQGLNGELNLLPSASFKLTDGLQPRFASSNCMVIEGVDFAAALASKR